ncbi:MAG: DUF1893 domain-containing protein [Prolixibacteraceae bacterium]|nr:DUF1893 domain-containing protein [Prolixibacteraceae bacterium]
MEQSLIVKKGETIIFSSHGKWLYPLFELEDFLATNNVPVGELSLQDKIAGKAAAFLIVRLGFKNVHILLASEGAAEVFKRFGVHFSADKLVHRIQCKTEEIVQGNEPPDDVWQMLRRRAGRVSGVPVSISGLSYRIGKRQLLSKLDLFVNKGEHIFIKGQNGVGKTTLLKLILGLEKTVEGKIVVGDYRVGTKAWNKMRYITGYVQQESVKNNFPVTAREVVEIGLAAQKKSKLEMEHRTEISMRRTGCWHLADHSYHDLSGGEKQRVNIARCLCQQAKVLLFDEPTSYLDPAAKEELYEMLNELWANEAPTVIIVSHDDSWIDRFNWPVYELKNGSLCLNS